MQEEKYQNIKNGIFFYKQENPDCKKWRIDVVALVLEPKVEIKPKDIEFVLVDKEGPPIDKNTKNRADKNSQAGGKHDPKRAVSLPRLPWRRWIR